MMLDATMKGRSCFFAAVFAAIVCMALPSFAAYQAWVGSTSDPCYWDVKDNWNYNSGGWKTSWTFPQNGCIWNVNNTLRAFNSTWNSSRTITFRTFDSSQTGSYLRIDSAASDNPIIFVSSDGSESYGHINGSCTLLIVDFSDADAYLEIQSGKYVFGDVNIANKSSKTGSLKLAGGSLSATDVYVGKASSATGILTVDGGSVTVSGNTYIANGSGSTGTLTIKNSMLTTKSIQKTGTATLNIDCGTLKFLQAETSSIASGITVNIGADGATFDTNSGDISVETAIDGTGSLLLTGGGTVTFTAAPSVKLFVAPGTKIVASTKAIVDAMLANGIELLGVSATGEYTVLSCDEALTGADVSKVTCGIAGNSNPATVGGTDDKDIIVTVSTLNPGWYIGPADGSLSEGTNWSDGNVPTSGNANIFCATPAMLTKGDMFAPNSITFAEGSAKVTIYGDAMASLSSIVVENGKENVMSNAVVFADKINVTATSGYVRFVGGATGTGISNHTTFYGKYNITATGTWTPPDGSTLKSGSELNLLNGTYYDHINRLTIEVGATVTVNKTQTRASGAKYLINKNSGVFNATNEIYSSTTGAGGYLEKVSGEADGGVFIANKLCADGVIVAPFEPSKTIVGPEGIMHGDNGYIRISNAGSNYFGSYADWQIYLTDHSHGSTVNKGIRKVGSGGDTTVTFDTTDYYDNTVGRTITAESGIGGSSSSYAAEVKVVVQGIGHFVFANTGTDENDFAGGLTVKDSATVEVRANARPGAGAITLNAGTTLALTATGTEFTPLANTLNLPTDGTATIRIDGARLRAGDHVIAPVASGTEVAIDTNSAALASRKSSWEVKDGNIVLSVKPMGTIIIFR